MGQYDDAVCVVVAVAIVLTGERSHRVRARAEQDSGICARAEIGEVA